MTGPLEGIRVLDFSTLLPGPMATLFLAEAGAEVIKIERPGKGEEMRGYDPKWGKDSVNFALLNRGKTSLALDLKDPVEREKLLPLIEKADVIVEQFRPGVMARLGLSYEEVRSINPGIIYCSITGYGQTGARAARAGHDLNYIGDTGLLALSLGSAETPVVPPALIADIAGGTYPAVFNILLALRKRDHTGKGTYLDIAMCDGLFPFVYWALGDGLATGKWPGSGDSLVSGGSCRYRLYPTSDGLFLAAAPLEQKFWEVFVEAIGLSPHLRDDTRDPEATTRAVACIIAEQSGDHWSEVFQAVDCCCSMVRSLQQALQDPHFRERGLFDAEVENEAGDRITALPVPVAKGFRVDSGALRSPSLGSGNDLVANDNSDTLERLR